MGKRNLPSSLIVMFRAQALDLDQTPEWMSLRTQLAVEHLSVRLLLSLWELAWWSECPPRPLRLFQPQTAQREQTVQPQSSHTVRRG